MSDQNSKTGGDAMMMTETRLYAFLVYLPYASELQRNFCDKKILVDIVASKHSMYICESWNVYSLIARKMRRKLSASWTIVGLTDVRSMQNFLPSLTSVKRAVDSMRWGELSITFYVSIILCDFLMMNKLFIAVHVVE